MYHNDSKEGTITENIIKEIRKNRHENLFAIPGFNEPVKGADLEWWIIYYDAPRNKTQAIHIRIQAKKQTSPSKYSHLDHDNNNGEQIDLLIQGAKNDKAIPLYCFYNRYFSGSAVDEAWKYAHAADVASTRVAGVFNTSYSTLNDLTSSMHELATTVERGPSFLLKSFKQKNATETVREYRHDELPRYVLDKLINDELQEHPFMKQNEWFKSVRKLILDNANEKGTTFYIDLLGTRALIRVLRMVIAIVSKWFRRMLRIRTKTLPTIFTMTKEPIFDEYNYDFEENKWF